MRNLRQIFVAFLLLFVATTAMAQSQSDNTQTKAVSATNTSTDITELQSYYWYVGNGEEILKATTFNDVNWDNIAAGDLDWSKAQQVESFESLGYSVEGSKITMNNVGINNVYILCPKAWSDKWAFWNCNNDIGLSSGFQEIGEILETTIVKNGVEYDLWWAEGYSGNIAYIRSIIYEEIKYYWYVGNGNEIMFGNAVDWSKALQVESFEELGYSVDGTKIIMNNTGTNSVYILCPKEWSNRWMFWNSDNNIDLTNVMTKVNDIVYEGVGYDLWCIENYSGDIAYIRSDDTLYYWYINNGEEIVKGTTPEDINWDNVATGDIDWTKAQQITSIEALGYSDVCTKITMNNTGSNSLYILCPKAWSNRWKLWTDEKKSVELTNGCYEVGEILGTTFTNSNIEYDLWRFENLYGNKIFISLKKMVTVVVSDISLDKETLSITEGEIETLTATITPNDATDKTVTWTTSDASIATVDNGVVTAVKAGTATITATAGAYSAACAVTVTAPVVPEEEGLSTSKYYRIKNVSAQLYLQVNGNNSNMALQSKGDELTLPQIFSLEDAADGKFYIKSTTTDAKYYAHASGWNFNATTNADSRTSFTISLVDGEENVYTLYQDESIYTGLAGADATTAGTLIYCNKNVDQNGKWQFEALTADETNEYIAILTAAAKPALEAAIANAESIVEARKAVLGASEIAAIEAVVATAKAQKDNTTDVDKLNALTDAINAAISDAVYVWSLDDLSNTVCYAVSTESRGSWYSEEANLTGTDKAGVEFNVTDKNQQFAFLQSEGSGYYYLYSVGAKKFVSASGSYTTLTDIPVETIIFLEGKRTDKFPWVVALNSTDGEKQIGVSNGYTPAVITSYNDLTDAGNTVRFEKVAAFDATAALAVIEAYEASTAIESVEMRDEKGESRDEKGEIYDLAGRKVANPIKGIYIVNGQRVLIK